MFKKGIKKNNLVKNILKTFNCSLYQLLEKKSLDSSKKIIVESKKVIAKPKKKLIFIKSRVFKTSNFFFIILLIG